MDTFATLAAVILLAELTRRHFSTASSRKYPPGPQGWPIIGNILDIPKSFEWLAYQRWAREYNSPIIHLSVMGTHIIVANDAETATDLFDKKGSIYSDRPRLVMLGELVGVDRLNFAFMRYGSLWRDSRKIFHEHFNAEASKTLRVKETHAAHSMLRSFLETSDHYEKHTRHMAGVLIMSIAYGIDISPKDDPYVARAEEGNKAILSSAVAGTYLVDILPFLKHVPAWFPGAGFQRQAQAWREVNDALYNIPFNEVKAAMSTGGPLTDSVTGGALAKLGPQADSAYEEECIRASAGVMYSAASDTSVTSLNMFWFQMLLKPDIQKKAQQQIDQVTGGERLPDFADQDSLPYITAIVKEVLRWGAIAPQGVPHRLTEDDEYKGYFIPKGSIVIGNSWAILRDEATYGPDAAEFNPGRFLTSSGQLDPSVKDPVAAYGYGRRICPGRYMANDSLWITVASVLAVFNIEKPLDSQGRPVSPKNEFVPGLVINPSAFDCKMVPRSPSSVTLIQATNMLE